MVYRSSTNPSLCGKWFIVDRNNLHQNVFDSLRMMHTKIWKNGVICT